MWLWLQGGVGAGRDGPTAQTAGLALGGFTSKCVLGSAEAQSLPPLSIGDLAFSSLAPAHLEWGSGRPCCPRPLRPGPTVQRLQTCTQQPLCVFPQSCTHVHMA